jgi:hypothetical protein
MAGKNDKWVLFKNYMHNELGITKEDIREWINDAIREEVKNVVDNAYGKCSIEDMIRKEIKESSLWPKSTFSKEVIAECAKQLVQKIELKINE